MMNCDDLSRLWMLLAALNSCDVPDHVKDYALDIMDYLERISKEL